MHTRFHNFLLLKDTINKMKTCHRLGYWSLEYIKDGQVRKKIRQKAIGESNVQSRKVFNLTNNQKHGNYNHDEILFSYLSGWQKFRRLAI